MSTAAVSPAWFTRNADSNMSLSAGVNAVEVGEDGVSGIEG
jgi:hypothetical protein